MELRLISVEIYTVHHAACGSTQILPLKIRLTTPCETPNSWPSFAWLAEPFRLRNSLTFSHVNLAEPQRTPLLARPIFRLDSSRCDMPSRDLFPIFAKDPLR